MALHIGVRCNCYREGKAKPFPLPELEQYFDAQTLDMDNVGFRAMTDVQRSQYYDWLETACEHPTFEYAVERINLFGLGLFRLALEQAGLSNFPTLVERLPIVDRFISPSEAAQMVAELNYFRWDASLGEMTRLVDTETGIELFMYIAGYNAPYHWQNYVAGVDPKGFFVAKQGSDYNPIGQEVFRSMRFEQRILEWDTHGEPAKVKFFDVATETPFVCEGRGIGYFKNTANGKDKFVPVRLAHVITRRVTAEDFAYIITPLEIVCRASIETGNPIEWC